MDFFCLKSGNCSSNLLSEKMNKLRLLFSYLIGHKRQVTAAVIEKGDKILIAKRRLGRTLGGKWEFPGGKIEPGETPEECLKRELKEEFDVEAGDPKQGFCGQRGDPEQQGGLAWVAPDKIYCCSLQPKSRDRLQCSRIFEADILESTISSSTVVLHFFLCLAGTVSFGWCL